MIVFVGVIVDIYYLETRVGTIFALINAEIIFIWTIFALINAGIIFISFRELSFILRVRAQLALCTIQTEINSRTETVEVTNDPNLIDCLHDS